MIFTMPLETLSADSLEAIKTALANYPQLTLYALPTLPADTETFRYEYRQVEIQKYQVEKRRAR